MALKADLPLSPPLPLQLICFCFIWFSDRIGIVSWSFGVIFLAVADFPIVGAWEGNGNENDLCRSGVPRGRGSLACSKLLVLFHPRYRSSLDR